MTMPTSLSPLDLLAVRAAGGDRSAEATVLASIEKVLGRIAANVRRRYHALDLHDAMQQARLLALSVIRRYDGRSTLVNYVVASVSPSLLRFARQSVNESGVRGVGSRFSESHPAFKPVFRLFGPPGPAIGDRSHHKGVMDPRNRSPVTEELDMIMAVRRAIALSESTERDREIVCLVWGLSTGEPVSKSVVARKYNISRPRVQQIVKRMRRAVMSGLNGGKRFGVTVNSVFCGDAGNGEEP